MPRIRTAAATAGFVAAALVLAGCGGGSPASSGANASRTAQAAASPAPAGSSGTRPASSAPAGAGSSDTLGPPIGADSGYGAGATTPEAALTLFYNAVVAGDWQKACEQMDYTWASFIQRYQAVSCPMFLADNFRVAARSDLKGFVVDPSKFVNNGGILTLNESIHTPKQEYYTDRVLEASSLTSSGNVWVLSFNGNWRLN